ncbi:MAG: glutamate-5-semialdehyde dehydrogenase [Helicobacteraceae bacterium]|jgi:glutamate-5-semialdehyde dehydrogenase|nr:glutamate-5-semialdehyde dehydrogenase [Helicobacteraceae bacterium]
MTLFLQKVKGASRVVAKLDGKTRAALIDEMANAIEANKAAILEANGIDMRNGADLSNAMRDRLELNDKRVLEIVKGLKEIAALRDPIGAVIEGWITEDNLKIEKVSAAIGVVGVIYESRPNVTADVAALCFKSANAAILKSGKEAARSSAAIVGVLQGVLEKNRLPKEAIALLPDSSREAVKWLVRQDKYIDLIVPRGGEALIKLVSQNATVPVVKHDKGVCHLYLHESAEYDKAESVAINAKVQKPSACNAIETLLIDEAIAAAFLPKLKAAFDLRGVELRGCEKTSAIIDVKTADETDWATEYLDNILSVKTIGGIDEAIAHIQTYGSAHSEAIIARDHGAIERFLREIDAACVYANASTRFTDGGKFGFGAEVGISTNKFHARGPMGIRELTTYKYLIYGDGQIRE